MKDKPFILSEIRRTAALNGGKPLGVKKFLSETGIAMHDWYGLHWTKWSDALSEAGFGPLEWVLPLDEKQIIEEIAKLVRKYGHYPTLGETQFEKRSNPAIPAPRVLQRRFGSKVEAIKKVYAYCNERKEYEDVATILSSALSENIQDHSAQLVESPSKHQSASGYVYLVKSGKLYKIGCSENHWRRKSELHKQTSEGIIEIHTIAAIDDPRGIEKYWHERFADKRQHGEWFDLSSEDISAFKKRKFM